MRVRRAWSTIGNVVSDNALLLGLAVVVTAILWIAAIVSGPPRRSDILAGLRNGVIVGLLLGLATAGVALLVLNSQPDAPALALRVGLTIGLGYLWLGAVLMPIGFLARGGYDWARYGTWAAIGIIIFAAGLGYTAYSSFQESPTTPQSPTTATPTPASASTPGS